MKTYGAGLMLGLLMMLGNQVSAQTDAYRAGFLIVKIEPEFRAYCFADTLEIPGLSGWISRLPEGQVQKVFPFLPPPSASVAYTGQHLADLSLIYYLRFDPEVPVPTVLNGIQKFPAVAYAEPWYRQELFYQPNDPVADTTNGLNLMWHLDQIKAREAWDIAKGDSSVKIGVIDSGTGDHPDLQANWARNTDDPVDGIDNDQDGYVDNYLGWDFGGNELGGLGDNDPIVGNVHGTWVMGIVGATADNGIGLPGICFNCSYLPIKGTSDDALGSIYYGYEGIVYAVTQGAQIVNCSWGGITRSQFAEDVIQFATVNYQAAVIAACGNSTSDVAFYPAAFDRVISVANTSYGDTLFSNSTYNFSVDVTAPGWQIYSTRDNSNYFRWGGTSASSPVVAGAVALVMSHFSEYTGYQAAQRLRITADDVYDENPGYVDKLGQGRINLYQALTAPPMPSIRQLDLGLEDLDGDGRFRAGEIIEIHPLFTNVLDPADNLTISLSLPFESEPFANVLDGTRAAGEVATGQVFKTFQPFRIELAEDLAYDQLIFVKLTYTDESTGYEDFEYVSFEVNPSYLDVTANQLWTTVNSTGNFGWNDYILQRQGKGVRYRSLGNVLFEGGFLIGHQGKVSDYIRDIGYRDLDFSVTTPVYQVQDSARAPFESLSIYHDGNNPTPIGLQVVQHTFAFDQPEWQNFVLMEYDLYNQSGGTLDSLYSGMFADWDIAPYLATGLGEVTANASNYDDSSSLAWSYDLRKRDPNYYGFALISDQKFYSRAFANQPGLTFNDSLKFQALSNVPDSSSSTVGETGGGVDVLQFISALSEPIEDGARDTVVFALMTSPSIAGLQTTRNEAIRAYRCEVLEEGPQLPFTWDNTEIQAGDTVYFQDLNADIVGWDWDFGDGAFSTEEGPAHVFAQSGNYEVTLRVDDGYCQGEFTQTLQVGDVTQFIDAGIQTWKVYPNPVSDLLYLSGSGSAATLNLELVNLIGQSAWHARVEHFGGDREFVFYLPTLPSGVYFFRVNKDGERLLSQRIIISQE